jgi:hypothetical protein
MNRIFSLIILRRLVQFGPDFYHIHYKCLFNFRFSTQPLHSPTGLIVSLAFCDTWTIGFLLWNVTVFRCVLSINSPCLCFYGTQIRNSSSYFATFLCYSPPSPHSSFEPEHFLSCYMFTMRMSVPMEGKGSAKMLTQYNIIIYVLTNSLTEQF